MHSSTSNFSQPTPEQPWKTVWVATLILTLLLIAGVEAGYRRIGIKPSISDVNDLWCFQRHTLHAASPETVVLAGSSRMHLGFSLDTWRKQLPDCPIVQLAIEGAQAAPVLEDLARDEGFKGTVICDVYEGGFAPLQDPLAGSWVEHYRGSWCWTRILETHLEAFAQSKLAFLNERRSTDFILKEKILGRPLRPDIFQKNFDREASADFSLVSAPDLKIEADNWRRGYVGRPAYSPDQLARIADTAAAAYSEMALKIEQRGGRVIFVRFPTTGILRTEENRLYPRTQVWDRFAKGLNAKAIHFDDYPELRNFECPDESHITRRDTPSFTLALIQELERQQLLPQRSHKDPARH